MSFTLPNPTVPANGQALDATPILANFVAIQQAIASFDGSQLQSKSIVEAALADAVNPRLRGLETLANFVYTGCVWTTSSGLAVTMSGGTIYVNGYRVIVSAVGSNTQTASKDCYVDIDYLGNVTYNYVSNNATAPSLTANAIRVAEIVTGSSTVSSITQVGSDSLGNIIYPIGPDSALKTQNPCKFKVYRHAAYTPTGSITGTEMPFDAKAFDTGNNVDVTTNKGRFTAPVAGFYFFNAYISTTNNVMQAFLYKNGAQINAGVVLQGISSAQNTINLSDILQLVANDYVEVWYAVNATNAFTVDLIGNAFSGFLVSAT